VTALAGIWRFDGQPHVDGDCQRMLAAQEIYGPHDQRQWFNGALAVGRQLFRTLPEDIHDRQPLHSRDGRLTLVADLRLDNRDELVAELGIPSPEASQLCDAAILLETFDCWGERAVERLVGDFAFALWDAATQRLFLARDFLGRRPLHYHRSRGFFAFASMPKGLHALAEIPYGPDEQMVGEFIVLMPSRGSRSFFRDIARVEPGHIVTVTRDRISSRRYWHPESLREGRRRPGDYVEGLRHHLDRATQSRLRGVNGAVATHLSAGLDSGAVTATAARLLQARGAKVVAFTAAPREGYVAPPLKYRICDEGPLAAATAAMYPNIEHVVIRNNRQSPLDVLDRMFYLCQRPMFCPCNLVWVSAINQAMRDRKLNILLVGEAGNLTASYNGIAMLPELLLAGRFIRLWRVGAALVRTGFRRRRGVLLDTFGAFMPGWLWLWGNKRFRGLSCDVFEYTAIRPGRLAELNLAALARARGFDLSYRPRTDGFTTQLLFMTALDDGDVYKGMLGGWGIDYRDPLADKRLAEYCLGIPTEEYLVDGVPRALARRAFSDRLPQAVLEERRLGHQAADWHEGLTADRANVAAELDRLAACAPAARALDIEKMKSFVEDWPSSGWERDQIDNRYRMALLGAISAGHFLRKASGANQ
jgi:asparagine synthase (glutamine-hydrolysing)